VWTRYDWCEDLAQQTIEPARAMSWQLGGGEAEVLGRTRLGCWPAAMKMAAPA
jgi:hypothetical protein